jgi:hypothetical protein
VPTDEEFQKDMQLFYEQNYQLLKEIRNNYDQDVFAIENIPFTEIQKCILETLAFTPKPC